jgi:hypothetical protein
MQETNYAGLLRVQDKIIGKGLTGEGQGIVKSGKSGGAVRPKTAPAYSIRIGRAIVAQPPANHSSCQSLFTTIHGLTPF